ncbi:hypothetical protein HPB51_028766 [Rhipicephalus microplus]|uniref:Uncharacterized protein n=1 Tax=Rhipicephalus microplus TaxID=6941 RepID=A0A9J6CWE4_RHIMP|nr:hypothetical protein HPB51_028766 [Rhipicephalus microplus]
MEQVIPQRQTVFLYSVVNTRRLLGGAVIAPGHVWSIEVPNYDESAAVNHLMELVDEVVVLVYFHCDASNPSQERCSVPPSCCRPESTFTGIFCGRSVLNLSDHEAWFRVHTGSCPDATNRYVKEHVMIIGGVCLVAVIVLAFIDMVTNAVIDEIDIIRKIYDHVNGAEGGVSSTFTT